MANPFPSFPTLKNFLCDLLLKVFPVGDNTTKIGSKTLVIFQCQQDKKRMDNCFIGINNLIKIIRPKFSSILLSSIRLRHSIRIQKVNGNLSRESIEMAYYIKRYNPQKLILFENKNHKLSYVARFLYNIKVININHCLLESEYCKFVNSNINLVFGNSSEKKIKENSIFRENISVLPVGSPYELPTNYIYNKKGVVLIHGQWRTSDKIGDYLDSAYEEINTIIANSSSLTFIIKLHPLYKDDLTLNKILQNKNVRLYSEQRLQEIRCSLSVFSMSTLELAKVGIPSVFYDPEGISDYLFDSEKYGLIQRCLNSLNSFIKNPELIKNCDKFKKFSYDHLIANNGQSNIREYLAIHEN